MIMLGAIAGAALALWVAAPVIWALPAAGADGAAVCPHCGPRPEREARFCSDCGAPTN